MNRLTTSTRDAGIRRSMLMMVLLLVAIPRIPASETIRIAEVIIDVQDGKTRENAVRKWIQAEEGQLYEREESLEEVLRRDVQELINLRVFQSVDYSISPDSGGSPEDRIVTFTIQDASTFVPVPLPLYDSNTGGLQILYVQIWDNMFGTLTDWFSLATMTIRDDDDGDLEIGPFIFAPRISNIRAGNFTYGVRFEQEREESRRYDGTILEADYRFDRSALAFNTEFRFGPQKRLYYTLEPSVEFRYGYTDRSIIGGYDTRRYQMGLEQSFYYDSVDFFGNSRRGTRAGITANISALEKNDVWSPVADIQVEYAPYFAFGERGRISYYARFMGLAVFGDTYELLGENIRGIPDATMSGDLAFYLNQTLGIGIWKWSGVWDLQIHPFFDIAFATTDMQWENGWNGLRRSAGADILLFIEKVPNLAFRFSWGMDLDSALAWGEDNKTEFIVQYAHSY